MMKPMSLAFMSKKRPRLFLEIGPEWIKWCVSKSTLTLTEILEVGAMPILPDRDAARPMIQELLKKYAIDPSETIAALPRNQVTARNLEVPSTEVGEIRKIIDLQALKKTPYAPEEIVYDYQLLNAFREGYSSLILVVVHRPVLNEHLLLLSMFGLHAEQVTLTTACSALWASSRIKGVGKDEVVAVLDVDWGHSDFFIYQGNRLIFTQNLSVGAERLKTPIVEWREKLWGELSRALQLYRSEEIAKEPIFLALTGASDGLKHASDTLSQMTGMAVKEVEMEPEIQRLLPNREGSPSLSKRLSFSAVLGMARNPKHLAINLVPQEVIIEKGLMAKGKSLLMTGSLILTLFILSVAAFMMRQYDKQAYVRWLTQQVQISQSASDDVESMRKKIQLMNAVNEGNKTLFQAIKQVHSAAPKGVYLTEMTLTKERSFDVQGRADSMQQVFELVNGLKADAVFKETEARHMTKRIIENREQVEFEVHNRIDP